MTLTFPENELCDMATQILAFFSVSWKVPLISSFFSREEINAFFL